MARDASFISAVVNGLRGERGPDEFNQRRRVARSTN